MYGEEILKAELQQAIAECERLGAENAQVKSRLGDSPNTPTTPAVPLATSQVQKKKLPETLTTNSPSDQKVIRFRSLFLGRDDVYAVRWEGKNGRTGFGRLVRSGHSLKRPLSIVFLKSWRLDGALMEKTVLLPRSL